MAGAGEGDPARRVRVRNGRARAEAAGGLMEVEKLMQHS